MDIASLDGMKRAQLQKLAKEAGIKANKKASNFLSLPQAHNHIIKHNCT